jgi:hypothetical protein
MPVTPLFSTPRMQKAAVALLMAGLLTGAVLGAQALAASRNAVPAATAQVLEVHGLLLVAPTGWAQAPEQARAVEQQIQGLRDVAVLVDPAADRQRTLLLGAAVVDAPPTAILNALYRERIGEDAAVEGLQPASAVGPNLYWVNLFERDPERGVIGHVMGVRTIDDKHHYLVHFRHQLTDDPEAPLDPLRPLLMEDVQLMIQMMLSMRLDPTGR